MVNGRGYDDQLKCITCDVCRPCHSILNIILKPVFLPNLTDLLCLQLTQVPRLPDLVSTTMTTMTQPITLPLVHERGVKILLNTFLKFSIFFWYIQSLSRKTLPTITDNYSYRKSFILWCILGYNFVHMFWIRATLFFFPIFLHFLF